VSKLLLLVQWIFVQQRVLLFLIPDLSLSTTESIHGMLINSNDVHVIVLCSQYFPCSLFRARIVCLSSDSRFDFCVGLPSIEKPIYVLSSLVGLGILDLGTFVVSCS
jgi:hypothetical protein